MIYLLYYRNKNTGKITNTHTVDYTKEIDDKIVEFNSNNENAATAHLEKVSEDSLTAYLYNTKQGEIKDFRQYLDNVAGNIYSLERDLNYIQEKVEEWERKEEAGNES